MPATSELLGFLPLQFTVNSEILGTAGPKRVQTSFIEITATEINPACKDQDIFLKLFFNLSVDPEDPVTQETELFLWPSQSLRSHSRSGSSISSFSWSLTVLWWFMLVINCECSERFLIHYYHFQTSRFMTRLIKARQNDGSDCRKQSDLSQSTSGRGTDWTV